MCVCLCGRARECGPFAWVKNKKRSPTGSRAFEVAAEWIGQSKVSRVHRRRRRLSVSLPSQISAARKLPRGPAAETGVSGAGRCNGPPARDERSLQPASRNRAHSGRLPPNDARRWASAGQRSFILVTATRGECLMALARSLARSFALVGRLAFVPAKAIVCTAR